MTAPGPLRIDTSDLPPQEWAQRLARRLNSWVAQVTGALTNLTFRDNVNCQIVDVRITGGTYALPVLTRFRAAPMGVLLVWARAELDPATAIGSAVWVDWKWDNDRSSLVITNVTGLTSGTSYQLRLLVLGG